MSLTLSGWHRLRAQWAAAYWLRSVPNIALWLIWRHHGENPHVCNMPERPEQMALKFGEETSHGIGR